MRENKRTRKNCWTKKMFAFYFYSTIKVTNWLKFSLRVRISLQSTANRPYPTRRVGYPCGQGRVRAHFQNFGQSRAGLKSLKLGQDGFKISTGKVGRVDIACMSHKSVFLYQFLSRMTRMFYAPVYNVIYTIRKYREAHRNIRIQQVFRNSGRVGRV